MANSAINPALLIPTAGITNAMLASGISAAKITADNLPVAQLPLGGAWSLSSDLTLNQNLEVATAGKGVKLPTTPANADVNTLDCYREGTWTPTLVNSSGTPITFTGFVANGNYVRIGRVVYFYTEWKWTGASGGTDNIIKCDNLPFTVSNINMGDIGFTAKIMQYGAIVQPVGTTALSARLYPALNILFFFAEKDNAAAAEMTASNLRNGTGYLVVTGFYFTD